MPPFLLPLRSGNLACNCGTSSTRMTCRKQLTFPRALLYASGGKLASYSVSLGLRPYIPETKWVEALCTPSSILKSSIAHRNTATLLNSNLGLMMAVCISLKDLCKNLLKVHRTVFSMPQQRQIFCQRGRGSSVKE